MFPSACRFGIVGLLAAGLAISLSTQAQEIGPLPQTVEEALHQMSDLAGVIFVGEVIAVRHLPGEQGASGIVEIDFRIDQAVRGCAANNTYTLREWAGLWQGGDDRYRLGQQLLMMLHTPGPTGFTSPVGGMNGALPIHAQAPASLVSAASASAPLTVDLRWVTTRLLHRAAPSGTQGIAMASTLETVSNLPDPPQQAPVSEIVGMLGSWQQAAP